MESVLPALRAGVVTVRHAASLRYQAAGRAADLRLQALLLLPLPRDEDLQLNINVILNKICFKSPGVLFMKKKPTE